MKVKSIFLISSLFSSIIIFWLTYGFAILNPLYDAWILSAGYHDIAQHYIGWLFYRQSPWHFPIGLIDNLAYPYQFSVIYTDSIPILAVFFKSISFLLPDTFQYFGIWGIVCLFLSSFFSSLIIFRLTKNIYYSLLCSLFFILAPVMHMRMFGHHALSSHWILLAGLYICVIKNELTRWQFRVSWCVLFGISVGVHAYFVPMLGFLLLGCVISNFLKDKKLSFLLDLILPILSVLFIMWILGAFSFGGSKSAGGFGLFSANLNTLFYSQSEIGGIIANVFNLKIRDGQYEGYGYLGAGVLILAIISCFMFFKNIKQIKLNKDHLVILFVLLSVFLFALSNRIYINETKILSTHMPFENLFSVFRCSGRFIWIIDYSLFIIIFYFIYKNFTKSVFFIVFVCLFLQYYDLKIYFSHLKKSANIVYKNDFLLKLPKNKNIIMCDTPIFDNSDSALAHSDLNYKLAYYAYRNSTSINDFNIARKNENKIQEYKLKIQNELDNGVVRDDSIYVFGTDLYKKFENVLEIEQNNGYALGYKK
ncbi:MAG: DUF6311 domain-containing protein [Campylobacter sp.]|uniref:DUF6311 domain-containing protein n=1 Tax=Campylobacter sp. TaxID=205 RepID=UPI002AA640AC|nr:DUF6311 domain-containing protein [Campylobacter sp.]MCI7023997.1 DUF6311 domain-containing protein [Campylobacter sp.]MCI7581292.1 DUF6311 domain-containing protein [Campylobacter sp.]